MDQCIMPDTAKDLTIMEEINLTFPPDNVHRCGLGYSKSTIRSCTDPYKQIEDNEQLSVLFKNTKLTAKEKRYFELYYIDQLSTREICSLYNVSPMRIAETIRRALAKLWKQACVLKMENLTTAHPHFQSYHICSSLRFRDIRHGR